MDADKILVAAEHGSHGAIEVLDDWARERGARATDFLISDAEAFELFAGSGDGYGYGSGSGDGSGLQISIGPLEPSSTEESK